MSFMVQKAILFSLIGGSGIFVGAFLASHEHIRSRWWGTELRHSVIAFGGGLFYRQLPWF